MKAFNVSFIWQVSIFPWRTDNIIILINFRSNDISIDAILTNLNPITNYHTLTLMRALGLFWMIRSTLKIVRHESMVSFISYQYLVPTNLVYILDDSWQCIIYIYLQFFYIAWFIEGMSWLFLILYLSSIQGKAAVSLHWHADGLKVGLLLVNALVEGLLSRVYWNCLWLLGMFRGLLSVF